MFNCLRISAATSDVAVAVSANTGGRPRASMASRRASKQAGNDGPCDTQCASSTTNSDTPVSKQFEIFEIFEPLRSDVNQIAGSVFDFFDGLAFFAGV